MTRRTFGDVAKSKTGFIIACLICVKVTACRKTIIFMNDMWQK